MARNKLKKFAELSTLPNAFEFPPNGTGTQRRELFDNDNPLTVELACGHGVFLVEMARRHPHRNFIGIDIKGARLWAGAKTALAEHLPNVHFLRTDIARLADYFAADEIDELWITFPDPFPKKSDAKRRLTAPRFLEMYTKILTPGGLLHLKTDNRDLFEYSLQTLEAAGDWQIQTLLDNVHAQRHEVADLDILSRYETAHLAKGKRIYYARWRYTANIHPITPKAAA